MAGRSIGTYLRWWLSKWFNSQSWAKGFPYGTMVINVSGSILLALAASSSWSGCGQVSALVRPACTGFCGGLHHLLDVRVGTYKLVRTAATGWPWPTFWAASSPPLCVCVVDKRRAAVPKQ